MHAIMGFMYFALFIGSIGSVILVVWFLYKISKNNEIQVEQNNKIIRILENNEKI
ncbi:hypothetical protein [Bacillus sp. HMF5848]|uniref:hypothetical protein n=1 Tax=Bacillus sp. HMF5848 TaxID=2495421 RepID=UPI00163AE920|nr:hypothetical protein [Bacillus sp. HMF5848]